MNARMHARILLFLYILSTECLSQVIAGKA